MFERVEGLEAPVFPTIESVIWRARDNAIQETWDYVSGGAGTETTLRRNRLAFDRIGFKPALMRDVRERDTSCDLFGTRLGLPVMFAPVGSIGRYHPDGPAAVAEVAEEFGALTFVGSAAEPGITEVRARAKGPLGFQLYARGDRGWITERVRAAEDASCVVLCLTADAAVEGRRERNIVNNFVMSYDRPHQYQANFTWADFEWLRGITDLPLAVKGITSAGDAKRALNAGADWIYVSNHGGRQLDCMPATIDVLPEIKEAVGDAVSVLVDSGFIHGADVVKAVALGAKAAVIGKLMVWSLIANGQDGLRRTLQILREELSNVMGLLGVTTLDELSPEYLRRLEPIGESDWIGFLPAGHQPAAANGGNSAVRANVGNVI